MHDFGDSDNKINTKSNIIIVWANIKCQRPSTLWAHTFNDKFGPFISHHKIYRMYFYIGCPVCFFMQNGFNLVIRWLVSLYMSLFLCLFNIFHQNALQVKQRENDTHIYCDKIFLGRVNWTSRAVLKHNSVNKTIQLVSLSFGFTFELKLFAE